VEREEEERGRERSSRGEKEGEERGGEEERRRGGEEKQRGERGGLIEGIACRARTKNEAFLAQPAEQEATAAGPCYDAPQLPSM
jgi:hypothetical protein